MLLSDKIWITRKARIYAERRLQKKAQLSQVVMAAYAFLLVVLSIWNLANHHPQLTMLTIFGSIAVLVASIFLLSQRYTERAIAMRNCYIQLDDLCCNVKSAEDLKNDVALEKLSAEYTKILQNIENHTEYDYLCVRFEQRNQSETTLPPFTWIDYYSFIWEKLWRVFLIIIYFFLPIVIVIIWNIISNYVSIN